MKKSVLAIILLFVICSCQQKNKKTDINSPQKINMQSEEEDFDQFNRQFFSDSLFQLERIIFPLESDYHTSSSKDESDDLSNVIFSKDNWVLLRNNYFSTPDSTVIINGAIYKKKILKTDTYVEESIYIEDSGFSTTLKFSLKNGKWYLVDYFVCDN